MTVGYDHGAQFLGMGACEALFPKAGIINLFFQLLLRMLNSFLQQTGPPKSSGRSMMYEAQGIQKLVQRPQASRGCGWIMADMRTHAHK